MQWDEKNREIMIRHNFEHASLPINCQSPLKIILFCFYNIADLFLFKLHQYIANQFKSMYTLMILNKYQRWYRNADANNLWILDFITFIEIIFLRLISGMYIFSCHDIAKTLPPSSNFHRNEWRIKFIFKYSNECGLKHHF